MRLYLVRHGEAGPHADDAQRALTPAGRAAVSLLADRAAAAGVRVEQIRHSGLVRARETAEILASRLSPPSGVAEMRGTRPMDDEDAAAIELSLVAAPVLLVTHMPFVAELAARLAAGRRGTGAMPFATAELRAFERIRGGERWAPVLALSAAPDPD